MTTNAIEEGIFDKINGATAITDFVSARIYRHLAPPDTAYPQLIFQHQAGGAENLTPNDSFDVVYLIKGVSDASADEAGDIADAIRSTFRGADLTVSGLTDYLVRVEQAVRFTEIDAPTGKIFWHAGHMVRVRLD